MLSAFGFPGNIMFKRYVVLAYTTYLRPARPHRKAWEFMEAVGGGMSYRVWPGKTKTGSPAIWGMGLFFKHETAARLEFERVLGQSQQPDTPKPHLYVVTAFSRIGAIRKVLDHVYGRMITGAERLA